jgi:hypothetical protein
LSCPLSYQQDNEVRFFKLPPKKHLEKFGSQNNFSAAWKMEASMENYQIRILRLDGSPGLITERKYLNSAAAIAAGKLLAGGRRFEVWNEDCCVFDGTAARDSLTSSPRPAA